jgi:hypothetical protein
MAGCLIASIMAATIEGFGTMSGGDIAIIWCYDLLCLVFLDMTKMYMYNLFEENNEVLPEMDITSGSVSAKGGDVEEGTHKGEEDDTRASRVDFQQERMSEWAMKNNERLSNLSEVQRQSIVDRHRMKSKDSKNRGSLFSYDSSRRLSSVSLSERVSVTSNPNRKYLEAGHTSLIDGNLRPKLPGSLSRF